MPSKLVNFHLCWYHLEAKSLPMEPNIAPQIIPNRSESRLRFRMPCDILLKPIWNRFGTALGGHVGAKIGLGTILKAFAKRSLIWYPFEVDFELILNGFWHLIGGQKEGVNSKKTIIADPSKSLIFLRKTLILLLREMCYSSKNKLVF